MATEVIDLSGIDAVALDFDGTIANTIPAHTLSRGEAFRIHGLDIPDEMNAYGPRYGATVEDVIAGMLKATNQLPHEADPRTNPLVHAIKISKDRLYAEIASEGLPAMPGAPEFIHEVAERGKKLTIVSDEHRLYVDQFLVKHDLSSYIGLAYLVTRETLTEKSLRRKPAPDSYLLAAIRMKVRPVSRMLVVEDSPKGALAGKRATASVLAVNKVLMREDFSESSPKYFADSLENVKFS